ncbi:MAG TPA: hypothetical protein VFX60_19340 [Micromonospora sp.]|nr:hypothetical protein [Micromonospora sp.]
MRSISAKVTADVSVLRREMRSGGDEVRRFGRTVKDTSRQADNDLKAVTRQAAALEVQLLASAKASEVLSREFARTGDTTLIRRIKDQQKVTRELADVRKLLPSNAELTRAGMGMGEKLATAFGQAWTRLASSARFIPAGGPVAAIGAPFVAGLVTLLGTAAAGAIIGGTAGLGIAGGLKIAANDPKVKADAADLASKIGAQLQTAAQPFVPAVRKVLAEAGRDFAGWNDELSGIFASSSRFLLPLEKGLAGLGDEVLPAIQDLLATAAPEVIDTLAAALPQLGDAIGDVLDSLSDNGPEAAMALQNMVNIVDAAVRTAGGVINFLTELYGLGAASGLMGAEAQRRWLIMQATQRDAADATRDGAAAADDQAGAADRAAAALQRQRAAAKALSDQIRGDADPVFAFVQAQDRLAEAQEKAAEATKKHGRGSREAREALRALAVAGLDVEAAAGQLGDAFDGKMTPRLRAALRAAHLTKDELAGVASMFRRAKTDGEQFSGDYKARVVVEYVADTVAGTVSAAKLAMERTRNSIQLQRGGRRWGGIDQPIPMAAGGMMSAGIYPASNPPLIKFAEPETGGEAYIPRRGNRARNLAILQEVASWPSVGAQVIPMAGGGVARASYVNVAPTGGGTRLDTAAAALSARDAVVALNTALRENGKSFSLSTAKGRENRSALLAGVRAAQDAAQAKYAETGSVRSANSVYDEYIRRLRDVLGQQRASADLLRQVGQRPAYDAGMGARNSSANVAYVQALIGRNTATATARQFFNSGWGKPAFNTGTPFGRDNFNALFEFLGAAEAAAQARFAQTGNARSATRLYNSSLTSLRSILRQAGMTDKAITALLASYGHITLGNRDGGVYEHMAGGGLRQAHIAAAGPTRYAYAEPSTGGELFAPRHGDLAKTRSEVQWAVTNWWGGGQIPWSGKGGGAMTIRVVVDDGVVAGLVRVEVDEAMGALADATIYQTAA